MFFTSDKYFYLETILGLTLFVSTSAVLVDPTGVGVQPLSVGATLVCESGVVLGESRGSVPVTQGAGTGSTPRRRKNDLLFWNNKGP